MLKYVVGNIRSQGFKNKCGKMSVFLTDVTNITAGTQKYEHHTRTESARDRVFRAEDISNLGKKRKRCQSTAGVARFEGAFPYCGGGQGGGRPGEKGAGGVREAGEEGAGSGIPKVAESGRKREKLRNIAQYFAIKKMQRGGSQKIQGGNRD